MSEPSLRVTAVDALAAGLTRVWFEADPLSLRVRAGQFLMLRCGDGFDPFLRRRFFYSRLRLTAAGVLEASLLATPVEDAAAWLAGRRPGDVLDAIGPFGSGFSPARGARHLLLAGEGALIAPLLLAADDAVARGINVTLVQGGAPAYPAALLPPEVEAAPPDATAADAIGQVLTLLPWADHALFSFEESLLRGAAGELRRIGVRKPVHVVRWDTLPCGTGLCGACAVALRRGAQRRCCSDGPVFTLRDLYY